MLPKKNRISQKTFPSSKVRGFRVFSPFFSAVFYQVSEKGLCPRHGLANRPGDEPAGSESRCSVVVSKKTAKHAVARNMLRRKFYELLAQNFKKLLTPTTVVVYPKIDAEKAVFEELSQEIEKAFRLAKLIK